MKIKKSIIIISVVILIATAYIGIALSINKYGNPYNFPKDADSPEKAVAEVIKNCKIIQVEADNDSAIVVCEKNDKQMIRYLTVKNNDKWFDMSEKIIYCKDYIVKDDKERNGFSIKAKKYRGKHYFLVEQFNYENEKELLKIEDSINSDFIECQPNINGDTKPMWLWCLYDLPDDYAVNINGEQFAIDN